MNTKYYLSSLIVAASAFAFASCNDIKEGDRLVELPGVATTERVVLLEEFTGQYCPNCPDAHKIIAKLLEQYPDNLIPVAIHGGDLAEHIDDDGLGTDDGNAYVDFWGVTTFPCGVLNRTTGPINRMEWTARLREMLEQPTWLAINLTATFDEASESIVIDSELVPEIAEAGKYQLWVLEDGIVNFQSDTEKGTIFTYVHEHVYRANVNGLWGEAVSLAANEPKTLRHTLAVDENWDPENLSVVAFFYNDAGVAQAAKAHLQFPAEEQ